MANRWGNNGNSDRLYFLGLQNHCSHEIKRHSFLGREVMTNLDSRDITLPTKICLVKVTVFPVVMYGCESWAIKKAECQRIDAFELCCWRRLLRVLWTARRFNQSKRNQSWILIGRTDAEAETPIGHLMRRTDSSEKTLMLGKIESRRDDRGWDGWMASPTWCTRV